MTTAQFVCLANSKKHNGRCLAGKVLINGNYDRWIRPITNHPHQELREREHLDQSGKDLNLLDLLEIKLINPKAELHQQENYLMDTSVPLRKYGVLEKELAISLVDFPENLWVNGHSSRKGKNDFVTQKEISGLNSSLYLLRILDFHLNVIDDNGKKFRGNFFYNKVEYNFAITDIAFTKEFSFKRVGQYPLKDSLITISLGEFFPTGNGYYKLIAGIIPINFGDEWVG